MKGKYLPFLILPVFAFALFLILFSYSAKATSASRVISSCIASSCGTSEGTKEIPVFEEVCDKGCPTVTFRRTRLVCPSGFPNESHSHNGYCYGGSHPNWPNDYRIMESQAYGPVYHVLYNKSSDPNKCHRPSDDTLRDFYNMDHDTRREFKDINGEHKDAININCHQEVVGSETVSCNDAPIIPCEEECPTECGYEGGFVPDGEGGTNECPATNSCSTYRWCFPDDESTTGYLAQALSISIPTPEVGKPWDSGKMLDIYCSYTPAGTCPTTCGLPASEVDDGEGGKTQCPATASCSTGEVLGTTDEVKDTTSNEAVLGTTSVVLAATGASDNILVYVVQAVLMLSTLISGTLFVKKYII